MKNSSPTHQPKRGGLWWTGRILLGLVALLLVASIATLLLGAKAKSDLKAQYPPPGTMVDVGGYRLHLYCTGTGSPTVVLESGAGGPSSMWESVRTDIAGTTRTCVYDRAGLGWSDVSPKPRTADNIVNELHTLLANAGVSGPYVLVGHSIGGTYVRLYATRYPNQVVGMVLVDSSHEDQIQRFPDAFGRFVLTSRDQSVQLAENFKPLAAMGVMAMAPSLVPIPGALSQATRETYQALFADDEKELETIIREQNALTITLDQIRAARITTLGNIPLVVLVHGHFDPVPDSAGLSPQVIEQEEAIWRQLQTELASLSPRGKLVVAEKSGHYIMLDQPELVIQAIQQVVTDASK